MTADLWSITEKLTSKTNLKEIWKENVETIKWSIELLTRFFKDSDHFEGELLIAPSAIMLGGLIPCKWSDIRIFPARMSTTQRVSVSGACGPVIAMGVIC